MFVVAFLILLSALASAMVAHVILYLLVFFFLGTFLFQVLFLSVWASYREKQRKKSISKIIKEANENIYIVKGLIWKVDDKFKVLELSQGANYKPTGFPRARIGSDNDTEMGLPDLGFGDMKRARVSNEEDIFGKDAEGDKYGFKGKGNGEKGGSRLKIEASSTLTQDTGSTIKKEIEVERKSDSKL